MQIIPGDGRAMRCTLRYSDLSTLAVPRIAVPSRWVLPFPISCDVGADVRLRRFFRAPPGLFAFLLQTKALPLVDACVTLA
jgi:hypothetical protein